MSRRNDRHRLEQRTLDYRWIEDAAILAGRCAALGAATRIGFDTEFMRVSTYWPKLALLQVSDAEGIDLCDPQAVKSLAPVGELLRALQPVKLMHSASEDLIALAPVAGGPVRGLFDTQIAAAFAGLGAGIGYQRLVLELLGIEIEKGEQRSDWLRRPLTQRQCEYAAIDVAHLPAVHDQLLDRLERRGMLAWAQADSEALATAAADSTPLANPHHEFKSLWKWPLDSQARLARLLAWREETARTVDRPRTWLIDNPTAVDLIERQPRSPGELAMRLAAMRGFPKRAIGALFDLLTTPLSDDELGADPIPRPLDDRQEARFEVLRAAVAARAGTLDLPAALLAPRRVLEALARSPDAPALRGWRREMLAGDIAAI
jgi:ribonuclease D